MPTHLDTSNPARPLTPELLSTKEASQPLNYGERTLRRWFRSGQAPQPVKSSGAVRYRRSELLDWIQVGCLRVDGRNQR
ncbi:MAG: helix-turn-helix domain-containing protein [Planctomycetaceae bacterium]|nr:helix-turn-helix domain-containing protein [Planctomycetales bacterium]MCB9924956.1 helix-turn-helix domain-containing protein [Planctomycetaceae bacterium]